MITIRQAAKLMDRVDYAAARLSDAEREQLVKAALSLGEVRILTLERATWAKALQILTDIAPSLADELTYITETVEEIHRRIPAPDHRAKNGSQE